MRGLCLHLCSFVWLYCFTTVYIVSRSSNWVRRSFVPSDFVLIYTEENDMMYVFPQIKYLSVPAMHITVPVFVLVDSITDIDASIIKYFRRYHRKQGG